MRAPQETATRSLLATLIWHPVDTGIAESAAGLGQHWLPSHRFIDGAPAARFLAALSTALMDPGILL